MVSGNQNTGLKLGLVLALGLASCAPQAELPPATVIDPETVVVKSRATIQISMTDQAITSNFFKRNAMKLFQPFMMMSAFATTPQNTNISVNVTNSASTSMTVSTTNFVAPTISNTLLDFGYIQLSSLFDNQLNLCGTGNAQKCTRAFIRMYTSGTNPGLYNSVDNFGAPLYAGMRPTSSPYLVTGAVGSGVAGATVVEYFNNGTSDTTIPSNQHVMRLTHFPTPMYEVNADFTDAGAGSYTATLVLEYALAP